MPHYTELRGSPQFVICDDAMHVVCASPDFNPELLAEHALESLEWSCRESRRSKTVMFEAHDGQRVMRIVPLTGTNAGYVALFIESPGRRGAIPSVTKNFGLTRREAEVLPLILRGATNSGIADILCVAESTIGDHVKNIMRKMHTTKRIGILHKAFNLEDDMARILSA
jgi:DNA-binding CsgD family transcriptional regulator